MDFATFGASRDVDHDKARVDANACSNPFAVHSLRARPGCERGLERKPRAYCAVCALLVRDRIAEERHDAITEIIRDVTVEAGDGFTTDLVIRVDYLVKHFWVHASAKIRRADEVAKQDCQVTAFTARRRERRRRRSWLRGSLRIGLVNSVWLRWNGRVHSDSNSAVPAKDGVGLGVSAARSTRSRERYATQPTEPGAAGSNVITAHGLLPTSGSGSELLVG